MKLLISGASGLLGLNLALEASNVHTVVGVDQQKLVNTPFEMMNDNLLEPGAVERVLDSAKPDWLIHCAALANLEACEVNPELARRLNTNLPQEVAAACKQRGIRMVQISTDAVFDGTKNDAYTENDVPNPPGIYAKTKMAAEQAVLKSNPDAIVARVNFYGFSPSGSRSLAEFFINNLSAGKPINGFTDIRFCPTFVGDLANLLLAMLGKGLHGVYHTVSTKCMTKYDFGIALAKKFGLDETLITPISVKESNLIARRAHNLCLDTHKLSTALDTPVPVFSTGLGQFYTQFQQGYPQKIRSYAQK